MTKNSTQAAGDRIQRTKRPTTVEHTRKRTQVACERCRKRKIKCSLSPNEAGCETCNNAGEKCVVNRVCTADLFAARHTEHDQVGSKEYTWEPNASDGDEHPLDQDQSSVGYHKMLRRVDSQHYQHGLLTPSASSRQGSVTPMPSTSHSSPYRSNLADHYGYGPLPGPAPGTLLGPPFSIDTSHRTINGSFDAAMLDPACAVGSFGSQNDTFHGNGSLHTNEAMPSARLMPRSDYAPTTSSNVSNARRPGRNFLAGNNNNHSKGNVAQARMIDGMKTLATPSQAQSHARGPYTAQQIPGSNSFVSSAGTCISSEESFSPSSSMYSQQDPAASATTSFASGTEEPYMNVAPYATMTTSSRQSTHPPDSATYASGYLRRPSYAFAPFAMPNAASTLTQSNQLSALHNSSLGYSPTTASYQYQPCYQSANNRGPTHARVNNASQYVPYNYLGPGSQHTSQKHRHHHHNHQNPAEARQSRLPEHVGAASTVQRQHGNSGFAHTAGLETSAGQERVQS